VNIEVNMNYIGTFNYGLRSLVFKTWTWSNHDTN